MARLRCLLVAAACAFVWQIPRIAVSQTVDSDTNESLGYLYANGLGVPQDYEQAVDWYRAAARQNFAAAQHQLGRMYRDGHGVPQDDNTAVVWFRAAAEQGHGRAQFNLAWMYAHGRGVTTDYDQALG